MMAAAFIPVISRRRVGSCVLTCHCDPVLDAGVGNLVAVATAVRRHVFSIIEIATSLDKLGMILRRAQDERKILAMTD